MTESYCVYGPSIGQGSNVQVARGMANGLRANGRKVWSIQTDKSEEDWDTDGLMADRAIYVGPYPGLLIMHHGGHRQRYALLAPNSQWLPEQAIKLVGAHAQAVAPSGWAAQVVRDLGLPCTIWPHGIDDAFRPLEVLPPDGLVLAHFSSSVFGRKGTCELVQAFVEGRSLQVLLDLYVDQAVEFELRSLFNNLNERGVRFCQPPNAAPEEMAKLYSRYSGVIQPSRGEAFGMVPLEARACGRVAIMTGCTGHDEHIRVGGFVRIPSGSAQPLEDGPDSVAPSVSPKAIAAAIDHYVETAYWLGVVSHRWAKERKRVPLPQPHPLTFSWKETTSRWLSQVES